MENVLEKDYYVYVEKGKYAPKEGFDIVRRENVALIIHYNDQYLFLSWNEVDYQNSLVTGGIDEGESREDAAFREIIEETGYYDIKDIVLVDAINISKFFVEHKGENREAIYYPYLITLNSLNMNPIAEEEKREHTSIWVSKDELESVDLFENHKYMLEKAILEIK